MSRRSMIANVHLIHLQSISERIKRCDALYAALFNWLVSSAESWIINQLTCYRSIIVRVWHMKRAAELHQRGGASPNVFDWNARIVCGLLTQPQVMIYWRRTHRWWAVKQLNYLIMDMSEDLLHYWSVWFVLTIHICVLRSSEAIIHILYTR